MALDGPLIPVLEVFQGPYKVYLTTHPCQIPINETSEKLPDGFFQSAKHVLSFCQWHASRFQRVSTGIFLRHAVLLEESLVFLQGTPRSNAPSYGSRTCGLVASELRSRHASLLASNGKAKPHENRYCPALQHDHVQRAAQ